MLKFLILMLLSSGANANGCVVFLYHHFSDKTPKSTSISPALFEQHLQYLQQNKFNVITIKTLLEKRAQNNLPDKCAALTADDAYQSIAKNAYPLLKKYQMPMSVFVATNSIDSRYSAMMTWDEMRAINGEFIQFYNHSTDHKHFLHLDKTQIEQSVTHAQNRLKTELGTTTKIIAYPYGESNPAIAQQLKKLGYSAFGQHSGVVWTGSHAQHLPRFPMAAHFAKMKSFQLKANTVPMPIIETTFDSIIDENPPTMALTFHKTMTKSDRWRFNCFASGGAQLTWVSDKIVRITAKKPLSGRRSKYNCTLPSAEKGRYHWFSVQWVNPDIKE